MLVDGGHRHDCARRKGVALDVEHILTGQSMNRPQVNPVKPFTKPFVPPVSRVPDLRHFSPHERWMG